MPKTLLRTGLTLACLSGAWGGSACAGTPPVAIEGTATDEGAGAFFQTFLSALNRRDWEGFRATFADDITVMFDQPGPPVRMDGRKAVEGLFKFIFPPADAVPRVLPPPVTPFNLLVQDLGGGAVVSFHVKEANLVVRRTLVLRRTPSGWRVAHIHGSSSPATNP